MNLGKTMLSAKPSSLLQTSISVEARSLLASIDWSGLVKQYANPQGYFMIGTLVFLIGLSQLLGTGKGKLTTGKVCGTSEKLSATNRALQQIKAIQNLQRHHRAIAQASHPTEQLLEKKLPHNTVTLWCGSPRYWAKGRWRRIVAKLQTIAGAMPTIWLPDAQRSILVIGAPGSGKTYSAIDRAVESALVQGIPVLLYDKKGEQMKLHAPLAARYGYEVFVFAPGEPFSGVLNPLDFIRDERDSVMAGELGAVINRNASSGGRSDEFFSKAGDQLAKGLLQLVKSTDYPDMAMLYAILRLPNLAKRLDHAVQTKAIDEWVATSFNQFLSAKDAEKTISGILATAAGTFSSFIQADLLRTFMGESTIPKRIKGKQIIIFKLDDERRSVIGPLLAAAIHLSIVSNLATPREDPIAVFLDELPSLKLDRLPQWINEYRSNGGIFMLGIQSLNQLYEAYGEKMGAAIASACSTHILFNPGDQKTAEEYSKRYGEKEVSLKNRSISQSSGQHSNRSTSWNESLQKIPLFTVDQILRFPEGKCVITSPGYRSGAEGSIPFPLKIPVPKLDQQRAIESVQLWENQVCAALQKQVESFSHQALTQALHERVDYALKLLPTPEEPAQSNQKKTIPVQHKSTAPQPKNQQFAIRKHQPTGIS